MCNSINSIFIVVAGVFRETFPSLSSTGLDVLYPVPDFLNDDHSADDSSIDDIVPSTVSTIFLSVNRYERKKNLNLAIEALGVCLDLC